MLRIHFTAEDLARLHMPAGLGLLTESALALRLFADSGNVTFHGWRRQLRVELGQRSAAFEVLARSNESIDELVNLVHCGERPADTGPRPANSRQAAMMSTLADFSHAAVRPYWAQVRTMLEAIRDASGRIMIASGAERLLGSLHPRLRWNAPVLELHRGPERDVYLAGRGLVLSPSFFLPEQTCLFVEATGPNGRPAVLFPVNNPAKAEFSRQCAGDAEALGALVGHTRAAALQVLTESCTTSELAKRLNLSLAGASKHASILRRAGLIMTTRSRNTALHTLTPLGVALLDSRTPDARRFAQPQAVRVPAA
ncbi:winged helix-turn-helix domain-containing protein [Streptomyces sp. NPDC048277]|uniref:ArsR/SmtB family transcription factor n=1 Tax=Streptomyces sp. NPDC048277 TaxID=3155027 RepID=UPI0033F86E05